MPTIPARTHTIPRHTHHCPVCGCHDQRRCQSIGTAAAAGDRHTSNTSTVAARSRPVFTCRMDPTGNGRCSNCQKCDGCGGPLGERPQLILVRGRKYRLCGTPTPCHCHGPDCAARLAPCRMLATGDALFDAWMEADRFGTLEERRGAADRWEKAHPDPTRALEAISTPFAQA